MKLLSIPIGIILILATPFVLWQAESQNRVGDFESATPVEASSSESGYIKVEAESMTEAALVCPQPESTGVEDCIYVRSTASEYELITEKECTDNDPKGTIIERQGEQCNSDGENCVPCYLTEREDWVVDSTEVEYVDFSVGNYTVSPNANTTIYAANEYTEFIPMTEAGDAVESMPTRNVNSPEIGDEKVDYEYIATGEDMVIVGSANSAQEISGKGKLFVVSALSEGDTVGRLQSADLSARWGLRILSLLMIIIGFVMIANTVTAIPLFFIDLLPFIGDKLSGKVRSIISSIASLFAFLLWLLIFAVIFLLKNIIALIIALVIVTAIIAGIYMFVKSRQGKAVNAGATEAMSA